MRNSIPAAALALVASLALPAAARAQSPYRAAADSLIRAATADMSAWLRIAEIADRFGPRLSGSQALENAIDWAVVQMKADGLENVHTEPVMVPHWVRGEESATLTAPARRELHLLGLGGSIGTPEGGIEAPVLVVGSFDELKQRAAEVPGKIVLFDVPFPSDTDPMETYGRVVQYRTRGASEAAKLGAVASLVRSIGPYGIQTPHAGNMHYQEGVKKIPTAALSLEDALLLHRWQMRGETPVVKLVMRDTTLADAPSRNVIGEIRGREKPDEVVVVSGHFDSWDVGTGSMDDAGGVVAAWEAVRLMKELGLRPRRTVRVVLWTNEENGTRGGRAYAQDHEQQLDQHVLAIESDNGVFRPLGFRFQGSDAGLAVMKQIAPLLAPIDATYMEKGEGEADVSYMIRDGVPGLALKVDDSRYFWYHHSEGDTPDKLDPHDVAKCVAAMAVAAYVAAEMPQPIPR
ncbi:MAG TPA: M20/M25/M40 family metallo-hydrolase [Longimicrobiaceae bacterium]|nr:M20/M25/M40 family metallo-hydrolase [Longimicrobiaceae bacterium]